MLLYVGLRTSYYGRYTEIVNLAADRLPLNGRSLKVNRAKRKPDNGRLALLILVAIGLIGLVGTAKAEKATDSGQANIPKDQLILVKEFTTEHAQVKGDNSKNTAKVAAKKERVPRKLVDQIVEHLRERGFTAAPYNAESEAAWAFMLDGDISLIHNGSGSARVWVGFGAGKAKMTGTVNLYSAANPSEIITSEKIKAASIGAAGVFGGGGNREDAVNRNFARKVASLLEDVKVPVETANVK